MKGRFRYTILGLLFLATTINYIDRQIIGLLKPTLEKEFSWTEKDYGNIVFWFQSMYAMGYILAGRFVDFVGAKIGYAIAIFFWSLAAMAHAMVRSIPGFNFVRGALGFSEGGNFPSAMKAIAEWFPVKERAFASGFMISGTTVGPILAPLIVLWLSARFGWQVSFIGTGALGLIWLLAWIIIYERPEKSKKVGEAELKYIINGSTIDASTRKVPIHIILSKKPTWGFFIATFLTDPVWWFYLFWLPSFLTNNGFSKSEIAVPITIVYAVTAVLSVAGGWLSSYFIRLDRTVNFSRKMTMFICVCLALPVVLITFCKNVWLSVMIISLAAAAQTVWKGVLLTSVTDQFPKKTVSSVTGIGGLGGAIGGMLAAKAVGALLDHYKFEGRIQHGYDLIFILCGAAYVVAFAAFHSLSPKMEKVNV